MENIKIINTERVLSQTQITLADYVINPYRGCEFNCLYCYSQSNKNITKENFKKTLGVKINAPQILEKELKTTKPKRVLLGSTTECFQYQESKYKITEQLIRILNNHNIAYTILTKSHLIKDYLGLIGKNKKNKIYFTFNFHNDNLINIFEKNSSRLLDRIDTIQEIIKNNISLRIHAGPYIPHICDLEKILRILPLKVKEIDTELYHNKQGNFKDIIEKVKTNLGKEKANQINKVYKNEKNYNKYSMSLKTKIKVLSQKYNYAFYYIVPDFNKFYNTRIDYKKPMLKKK